MAKSPDGSKGDGWQEIVAPTPESAIEGNLFEFLLLLRRCPRARVKVEPDLVWCTSNIPHPLFNSLWDAQLPSENIDGIIEAAIARGRSKGVPLLWWTGPTTNPADLGVRLVERGFVDSGDNAGMIADLTELNGGAARLPSLTIEQVRGVAALKAYCHVLTVGFGEPAPEAANAWQKWLAAVGLAADTTLRHYLGRLGGKPVATASLFFGAGVAGIHNVATLPESRRQGVGSAMTLAVLRDARAAGHRTAVLHASGQGYNIYRRLGFREVCKIGRFVWMIER